MRPEEEVKTSGSGAGSAQTARKRTTPWRYRNNTGVLPTARKSTGGARRPARQVSGRGNGYSSATVSVAVQTLPSIPPKSQTAIKHRLILVGRSRSCADDGPLEPRKFRSDRLWIKSTINACTQTLSSSEESETDSDTESD